MGLKFNELAAITLEPGGVV